MQEEKSFNEKEPSEGEIFKEKPTTPEKPQSFEQKESFKREEEFYKERRLAPSIEKIQGSVSLPSFTPKSSNLLGEDQKLVNSLVSIVFKNPNIEEGLEEANKILNEEAKRRQIKEDSELAYLIDAFHDELVKKLREREQKFHSL